VREESHLDDMRAAIRGDFERLEERRGEQELMRVAEAEREPEPEPDPVLELEQEPEPEPEPAPSSEPEMELPEPDVHEDPPATEPELRGEAAHKTSWLDRLLGR
jgi:hypothetical protein